MNESDATLDVIAQHMKFTVTLRLLVEELSTLASAFEVDGGQLRFQVSLLLKYMLPFHTCFAAAHKN